MWLKIESGSLYLLLQISESYFHCSRLNKMFHVGAERAGANSNAGVNNVMKNVDFLNKRDF